MGLFAKAAKKSTKKPAKKTKATIWTTGGENAKVGESLGKLVVLQNEVKSATAKMAVHKKIVNQFASDSFIADFSDRGVLPDTPMKISNVDGDTVSYVVQDRSAQYNLKDEQIEMLNQILGEDATAELLYTETKIGFNRTIMAIPGVSEAIEKALESAVKRMLKAEILDGDEADELLTVDEKTAFKPGTLDRAASLVGNDQTRLGAFLGAMASSCCRYVKV